MCVWYGSWLMAYETRSIGFHSTRHQNRCLLLPSHSPALNVCGNGWMDWCGNEKCIYVTFNIRHLHGKISCSTNILISWLLDSILHIWSLACFFRSFFLLSFLRFALMANQINYICLKYLVIIMLAIPSNRKHTPRITFSSDSHHTMQANFRQTDLSVITPNRIDHFHCYCG